MKLEGIKRRYFRDGYISHHGDCRIYGSGKVSPCFCSCGLIHDLIPLDYELAGILYPDLHDDEYKQEMQKEYETPNPKDFEESTRLLEELFGKPVEPSKEEIERQYQGYIKSIKTTFGDSFPDAERRAREKMTGQVTNSKDGDRRPHCQSEQEEKEELRGQGKADRAQPHQDPNR